MPIVASGYGHQGPDGRGAAQPPMVTGTVSRETASLNRFPTRRLELGGISFLRTWPPETRGHCWSRGVPGFEPRSLPWTLPARSAGRDFVHGCSFPPTGRRKPAPAFRPVFPHRACAAGEPGGSPPSQSRYQPVAVATGRPYSSFRPVPGGRRAFASGSSSFLSRPPPFTCGRPGPRTTPQS